MGQIALYWLPLGAGGWFVRLNGIAYERVVATIERRPARALFHSALIVDDGSGPFAIELCPEARDGGHGRVAGGPVGSPLLGGLRLFRYEARCWAGGEIPDLEYAVDSPKLLSSDRETARAIIESAPQIPTPTWGRDELAAGEMWNSNSVIAWLLEVAGLPAATLVPPRGGRAPGWAAGVEVARRRV